MSWQLPNAESLLCTELRSFGKNVTPHPSCRDRRRLSLSFPHTVAAMNLPGRTRCNGQEGGWVGRRPETMRRGKVGGWVTPAVA